MTPCSVLCVLRDAFSGGDILTRKNLINLDKLALEGVTSEVDGLVEGSEILLVVTDTSVKVVVDDLRGIERVCRAELDGSCIVARMGLENSPGKPVVLGGSVDTVTREVTTEVDGATKDEDVKVVLLSDARLVEHGGAKTGGRIDTAVSENRVVVTIQALVLGTGVESTAIERGEIRGSFTLNVDLIVVLEVSANTGKVDDNGNVKLLELVGGSHTRKLQELGRVVGSTGDDDLARSSCRSSDTSIAGILRTGLVKVSTVKKLDTSSARRCRLVEGNLGNVAVGSDI